jgi:hypothetical protein
VQSTPLIPAGLRIVGHGVESFFLYRFPLITPFRRINLPKIAAGIA